MRLVNLTLICLLGIVQFTLWFGEGGVLDGARLQDQKNQQISLNAEMQQENLMMREEIKDLKYGRQVLESMARSQLGMIREGEIFIRVIDG